ATGAPAALSQLSLRVHHVEIHTKRLGCLLDRLCAGLNFRPTLVHPGGAGHGALVTKGRARFLLRPLLGPQPDSVVDVAFETPRLDQFIADRRRAEVAVEAACGAVPALRFQSPASGGLWHTVLQQRHQMSRRQFLAACFPDLVPAQRTESADADQEGEDDGGGAFIDHVALACHASESARILAWYESIFQLPRYRVNSTETEGGFTVRYKDSGMNLKAIASNEPPDARDHYTGLKFVFAESLNSGPNQINTFLREHGGSGVQHVAIHLDNFVQQVAAYRQRGVEFMDPPAAYYSKEIGKVQQIAESGLDLQSVRDNQILVDCEADGGGGDDCPADSRDRYLMQVFTKPLLSEDTFFLELISRVGARGFGAGNISALWRAVEAHMLSRGQL
ncbi:hypothetical protein BOX15_Mlig033170g2, partial [Macrostomum lignano]